MDVIVKGSPKIEINFENRVIKVESCDFNPSGTYPGLTAGDLAGRGESVPASFGFRASGGKSIKDGRAYIKRIKGNSVVWNQLAPTERIQGSADNTSGTSILYTEVNGLVGYGSQTNGHMVYACVEDNYSDIPYYYFPDNIQANLLGGLIFKANTTSVRTSSVIARVPAGVMASWDIKTTFVDLTKMFGVGNEPSTIEEFNARVATLGVDLYAYNEGEVIHCNTESIKSVGDNAWDGEWENGTFNTTTGNKVNHEGVNGQIRCKNPIRVLPNEEYYTNVGMWAIFEDSEHNIVSSPSHTGSTSGNSIYISTGEVFITPSDASYMRFYLLPDYGSTYKHDILISLYHSGWKAQKDDQYQPYWQDTLPLPIIRKYFPQEGDIPSGMKKAGSAHDEIRYNKASGKWEAVQRIGSVDLGTLTWELSEFNGHSAFFSGWNELGAMYADGIFYLCAKYQSAAYRIYTEGLDKSIALNNGYYANIAEKDFITIRDSSYTDAASLKASLQGVILYYELAEPIVTELDEADQDFRDYYQVADFGTEMSQSNVPSAAFSADIIYQFNAVDMIREHEVEINELQSIIATMQAQLASLTSNNG